MSDTNNAVAGLEKPTLAEMADAGFHEEEIKSAEKHGLTKKEKVEVEGEGEGEPKKETETKVEEPKKEEQKKETPETNPLSKDPDVQAAFTDPEKEKELLKDFNKNETALYFKMKKERQKRQTSESEKEHLSLKLQVAEKEAERLKKKIERLKKKTQKTSDLDIESVLDEEVKPKKSIEPEEDDDKDEDEKSTKEEQEKQDKEKRAEILRSKLTEHEIEARSRYEDFDKVTEYVNEILKDPRRFYKDNPRLQSKMITKAREFIAAISNADRYQEGEYGPADMAYELGQMHPDFKKSDASGKDEKSGKQDKGLTPDQIKKIQENASKRSVASLIGSSREKPHSWDDLTPEKLAKMSSEERKEIPMDVRNRILKNL